jgi:hypothetical protein
MVGNGNTGVEPAPVNDKNAGNAKRIETWGIPASVALYGRFVVISGRELSSKLETLYLSGVREVEAVVDAPGRRVMVTGKIYKRYKKDTGRTYYFIYPRHAAQVLLRELYFMHRGDAAPNTRTPLPVIVVMIMPRGP